MASRQWLKDNPKVLGYVPQPLYQRLQRFTVEREVSLSKALTLILETYFELAPASRLSTEDVRREAKLNHLEQEVKDLRAQIASLRDARTQLDTTALTQNGTPTQKDESQRTSTVPPSKIKQAGTEPVSQTTTPNEPQKQSSFLDYPPPKAQAAPATESEPIPLYQTIPMSKRRRKLGKDDARQHSSEPTALAKSQLLVEGGGAPTDASENAAKRLSEKEGFFAQLRLSGASQPALPPTSDP